MRTTRWIALLVSALALAGLGLGLAAYLSSDSAGAQAPMVPEPASWMPATGHFVAYLDLAALSASPLAESWRSSLDSQEGLARLEQFREKTGMDPWTDFQALAWFAQEPGKEAPWGLALMGALQPERILSIIEEQTELTRQDEAGTPVYLFDHAKTAGAPTRHAVAFPNASTALFGPPEGVRAMLDVGAGRAGSVSEGPLAEWLSQLPFDASFWCVGTDASGGGSFVVSPERLGGIRTPPLQSFAVSGDLAGELLLRAWGRAADADSARKMADVVRGFLALGSLQQQHRPDIQGVLDSVQIELMGDTVEVVASVPYELLQQLARSRTSAAGESPE